MNKKVLFTIGLVAVLGLSYNNCDGWSVNKAVQDSQNNPSSDPNANQGTPPPPPDTSIGGKAMLLLSQQCGLCHGPNLKSGTIPFDVTSWDSMVTTTKVVIPNNLNGSILYTSMLNTANPMPPAGLLQAANVKIVADWINAGAPKPGAGTPPPVVDVFDPAKTPKTFANVKKYILDRSCLGCHGAVVAEDNVRYDTYANTLRTVNNGKLVGEIQNDSMPPNGDRAKYAAVNAAELQFIKDWIALGAPQ